jgi:predicted TIM-barrel fold metal-dependent hydrolase
MAHKYADCDGHVMENSDELVKYVGEPFKTTGHMNPRRILPSLDRFHTPRLEERKPGTFDPSVGPEKWVQFLEKAGLEFSVLFPTEGLAYGQIAFAPWAIAYARAYNDWLRAKYLNFNSRLKGMALIPMQDVPAAVMELRRAVQDLGMVGAMLPSNGLNPHLSAKHFWPVYEEFPGLRVGFLEGGTAWIPMVIDRLERELEYGGLRVKRKPEDYFKNGKLFVGCEGNEKALAYAIDRVGPEPFMFASDFPHEISLDNCMEEIDEIVERHDLKEEHKEAILGANARRFYKI